jgi:hypothetical protein
VQVGEVVRIYREGRTPAPVGGAGEEREEDLINPLRALRSSRFKRQLHQRETIQSPTYVYLNAIAEIGVFC